MANKGKTGYLGMFAYIAIVINLVGWLFTILHKKNWLTIKIGNSELGGFLTGIGSLILVFVAIFVAHDFAERQTTFWRVLYWILAISSILAILFGVGVNFF